MNLSITISDTIVACRHPWDGLLPKGHHLQSSHLQAFEQAAVENIQPKYVQLRLNGEQIGLLYLQQFTFEHKHLNFSNKPTLLSKLIQLFLPAKVPLLVCGHLFRINFEGFYFKDPAHQRYLAPAINLFLQQQRYRAAGIIIKDCPLQFIEQDCSLAKYRFFDGDITMEISRNTGWLNFEDYINSLKKDYRQRAKKIRQRFYGIELKELSAAEILEDSAAIEQLYWNVVNKQTVRLGTVNIAYFYELKKHLQERFEFHGLYKDGKMVAFYTFIFYDNSMETHFIGLDYDANKSHQLYFNILFLSIKKMIDTRYNLLELGRTGREAKANAGAVPRQVFNYIKVNNLLVNFTVKFFLGRFNKIANYNLAERKVFK